MSIQFVKSTDDFNKYVARNKFVVANFTASWCGPCQMIKPVVDQLYNDPSRRYERLEIIRVDLDSQRELATKFKVSSVPSFVFLEKGSEYKRVNGANIQALIAGLDEMNERAKSDSEEVIVRQGNGAVPKPVTENAAYESIRDLIPRGFQTLNESIDFANFQALNALPLYKGKVEALKNVFKLTFTDGTNTVLSDADSQILFFVPLLNISKVYSVFIKFKNISKFVPAEGEELELDEDELHDETQDPNIIKVYANQLNVPTFDEASGAQAPHSETIERIEGSEWFEAKLKFVRFQSVQSLTIFLDGENEDYHTVIDKIVVVGVSGDSKEQGSINKGEDEE
ncbi:thioredoxin [Scheffersomyces amazonensis]|uniref:thioredoxin n=1 Tax=Scheffersomyces amazonensis TaxID=1078765 RepID=UPI00315DAB41